MEEIWAAVKNNRSNMFVELQAIINVELAKSTGVTITTRR